MKQRCTFKLTYFSEGGFADKIYGLSIHSIPKVKQPLLKIFLPVTPWGVDWGGGDGGEDFSKISVHRMVTFKS